MVVDKLDTTFAALSDPTRRAIIERLSHGPASVHGLTEPFALSQQMISKHIAYLVRARIVIKTKRGRERVCTLRPEAIKTVSDWSRSEEHTSELQSLRHLVCRLLLEKKEHTSELQSLRHLVCRLLLESKHNTSEPQALRHVLIRLLPALTLRTTALHCAAHAC